MQTRERLCPLCDLMLLESVHLILAPLKEFAYAAYIELYCTTLEYSKYSHACHSKQWVKLSDRSPCEVTMQATAE